MSTNVNLHLPLATLAIASTSPAYICAGVPEWRRANNLTGAKLVRLEIDALTGLIVVGVGIQLTNDRRTGFNVAPTQIDLAGGTPTNFANASGIWDPNGLTAISSGAYAFWRPVWIIKLSSGSTLGLCYAFGEIALVFG